MIINDGYLLLFFDFPSENNYEKQKYNKFIINITKNGYILLQKSVYYKYLRELKMLEYEIDKLKKESIKNANIKAIRLTRKQFECMINLSGNTPDINISNTLVEY